jgi:hypothetical protein
MGSVAPPTSRRANAGGVGGVLLDAKSDSSEETKTEPTESDSLFIPAASQTVTPRHETSRNRHETVTIGVTTDDLMAICRAFPGSGGTASPAIVGQAVKMLFLEDTRGFASELDACRWLLGRVQAWAKSPLCQRSEPVFRPHPKTWLREKKYDEDDAQWAVAPITGKQAGEYKASTSFRGREA